MEDVDKRVEWLHCESHFAGDIFGEPQKTARIGDEYQAQIPPLMTKNECLQLIKYPVCHEVKTDDQNHFDFGQSIPVTWSQYCCWNVCWIFVFYFLKQAVDVFDKAICLGREAGHHGISRAVCYDYSKAVAAFKIAEESALCVA
ncbi:Homeodomain-like protein [Artemisia annua]|uniref:Homeodomain-like protein n=1 Tax=Artemisia annua TaxID=35608 RepID=A0A2U1L483_ARTAN|nr:Homeodomain-like protein [Artemisia annua]